MKRSLLVVTVFGGLAACQQAPQENKSAAAPGFTPGVLVPFSLPLPFPPGLQVTPGKATLHCDGQGHDSGKGYPKCHKGIPLVVLDAGLNPQGKPLCVSLLPYNELVIHTGKKNNGMPKDATVVWEIFGSDEYVFGEQVDGSRVDGIALRPQPLSPDLPAMVYDGKGFDGTGKRRYKWRSKDEAPTNKKFNHDAVVVHQSGSHRCEPIDPVIINQDN